MPLYGAGNGVRLLPSNTKYKITPSNYWLYSIPVSIYDKYAYWYLPGLICTACTFGTCIFQKGMECRKALGSIRRNLELKITTMERNYFKAYKNPMYLLLLERVTELHQETLLLEIFQFIICNSNYDSSKCLRRDC